MPPAYFARLKSAIQNGIQRPITRKEGGIQETIEAIIGLGKFGFDTPFFYSSSSRLTDLKGFLGPATVSAASSDLLLIYQRRNLTVVGAVSRTFSVPSVSGPSFQVCGYHIDHALSDPNLSATKKALSKPMAVSGSKTVSGERLLEGLIAKHGYASNAKVVYSNRNVLYRRKTSMSLNQNRPDINTIYGYLVYDAAKRWINLNPSSSSGFRLFHCTSSNCFSASTSPDVSYDNSADEEKLKTSEDSSDGKTSSAKLLKLLSGVCYLPHPDKEETGGEDAHFICSEEQAVGVADGVGGWADLGVDAGQYSRELMSNAVNAVKEEPKGSIDPARVLERAYCRTKAKGSSTACIIALTDQGLHAINLGDSGFMVVRDGCTVFRSPIQQHDFNFTYQLEGGNNGDLPSSGQVFMVSVAPGDVIVAGTDGLFDNLYNNEITAVVVHAMRAGLGPQVTAQKIAALARQRALDKDRQTPFSTAAQDAGFRYYGGKLDDITVVVACVTGSNEEKRLS